MRRNRWRYFLFGLVQMGLQMIPVASIFFLFTTGTGAALWATEYERRMWKEHGGEDWEDDGDDISDILPPPKFVVRAAGGGQKSWITFWRR